jgi:hypothetical protein
MVWTDGLGWIGLLGGESHVLARRGWMDGVGLLYPAGNLLI